MCVLTHSKLALLPVILLVFLSCRFEPLEPLRVTGHTPEDNLVESIPGTEILISFSQNVKKSQLEKYFTLDENGTNRSGSFEWLSGNKVRFIPDEPLVNYRKYTLTVPTEVEDEFDNSMEAPFIFSFSNILDEQRPYVSDTFPERNSNTIDNQSIITVDFSEAMDTTSVLDSFTISPSISGSFSWNDELTQMEFTPYDPLSWQTEYNITISDKAADLIGNTMAQSFSFSFFVGEDSPAPVVREAGNGTGNFLTDYLNATSGFNPDDGWESDWNIHLYFAPDVEIDIDSLEKKLEIEPAIPFHIQNPLMKYQNEIIIVFDEAPHWDEVYRFHIKDGYYDRYENEGAGALYYIRFDGALSKPPAIEDVVILANAGDTSGVLLHDYDSHTLASYNGGAVGYIDLYVSVADRDAVLIDSMKFSLMESFDFDAPSTALSYTIQQISQILPGNPSLARAVNPDELVFRIFIYMDDGDSGGLAEITVAASLSDTIGHTMAEDFKIRFQIQ